MKPRALDLFCCAGGATRGLQEAGFHVTGVDIKPQPRYVGNEFHQANALTFPLDGFEFIWASPPCQAHTAMKAMHNAKDHDDLIPQVRRMLLLHMVSSGVNFVIENVEGAPLLNPALLCGTMFDLGCDNAEVRRHRLFECSFPLPALKCRHGLKPAVIGIYGGHLRNRRRRTGSADRGVQDFSAEEARRAVA